MARQSHLLQIAELAILMTFGAAASAGESTRGAEPNAVVTTGSPKTGIRTDRLSPKQLRVWKSIEKIVFAEKASGVPLHPRLQSLWRRAESSGHTVFIEFPAPITIDAAGQCLIEDLDPRGKNHVFVIRLYLPAIERAAAVESSRRPNGLIPFKKLATKGRYAEIFGHELAHAVLILDDANYENLTLEQAGLRKQLLSSSNQTARKRLSDPENRQRLSRLIVLDSLLEDPVNAIEMDVWRELMQSGRGL